MGDIFGGNTLRRMAHQLCHAGPVGDLDFYGGVIRIECDGHSS